MHTHTFPPHTAPPPITHLDFDAWLAAQWSATRYRDQYVEDFGSLDAARYAAVSGGGDEADARSAYLLSLLAQPRTAALSLAVYDTLPEATHAEVRSHFVGLDAALLQRDNIERTLADGVQLFVARNDVMRPESRVLVYRPVAPDLVTAGESMSVPLYHPGAGETRAKGVVREFDGALVLEARTPGSACTSLDQFPLVEPFAYLCPGARPEPLETPVNLRALNRPDYLTVDERPSSVFYVTGRRASTRNGAGIQTALLLGPFPTHLEALTHLTLVRRHLLNHEGAGDVLIGSSRLSAAEPWLPPGKLNASLLSYGALSRVNALLDAAPERAQTSPISATR